MGVLSKLFRQRPKEAIRLLGDGFAVDRGGKEHFRVFWPEVREIVTFKRDLITTDCVCLAFRVAEQDLYFEINEEIPGFGPLADDLPRHFTDIPQDWFASVTQPPFKTNWTRLHGEPPPAT